MLKLDVVIITIIHSTFDDRSPDSTNWYSVRAKLLAIVVQVNRFERNLLP